MRTAMHQAVHDDAWLYELPDGNFLGPGLSLPVGGPYDPQACSAVLLGFAALVPTERGASTPADRWP
ncbi:hypothetical protein [Blastococcus capsensis]|uniref:hypothetical protein n=1 Tax=Blastococcus capsensis TaxID=1564163 RepID=UPI002541A20C|nr:hypothetical protein [Blastococcus capsensis]MDK3255017.1 hypothetical protein [Blastococcus capsensis]